MKFIKTAPYLLMLGLAFGTGACSDDKLDEIDTNVNSPETATLRLLLPQVETNSAFGISGTDLAWHASIFVEHSAGVHAQFEQVDKRAPGSFNSTSTANSWDDIYANQLADLEVMIAQGSTGSEAGSWRYVGIAKILKAYVMGIATDLFGRVPYSEAAKAPLILKPTFDSQQSIYANLQTLLDEAIQDLDKPITAGQDPTNADLFYNGDAAKWKKVAYSLKARYHNHLSKRDPAGSATRALAAINSGFASGADDFTFSKFTATSTGENPWFQERNDRSHFAVSRTFFNILTDLNDPRRATLVGTTPAGTQVAAPSGASLNDQGSTRYSRASSQLVNASSPLPLMTFSELKFIEAEAQLRAGRRPEAYTAYLAGVNAALARQFVTGTAATTYVAQPNVSVGAANLTLQNIITQKYISFYVYQPIEAYNDYRRTGFPTLTNTRGVPPRRFPYPQGEIDNNAANVPSTGPMDGVWWDDGTED